MGDGARGDEKGGVVARRESHTVQQVSSNSLGNHKFFPQKSPSPKRMHHSSVYSAFLTHPDNPSTTTMPTAFTPPLTFPSPILSSYKLSHLSHGAFSNIYLLQSHHNNTLYVLKLLPRTLDPERILSEMRILYKLRNVGAVNCQLIKVYHCENHYFLKMNYVEGSSIYALSHLRSAELGIFLHKCLMALQALYQRAIIHWDMKQTNILYNPNSGAFALVDFGLAREAHYRGQSLETMLQDAEDLKRTPHLNTDAIQAKCWERDRAYVERGNFRVEDSTEIGTAGRIQAVRPRGTALSDASSFYNVYPFERAGTVGFKAPELIIESHWISDRIDVWGMGVVLAGILSGKGIFFRGKWLCDIPDKLQKYTDMIELTFVFGTDRVVAWLKCNVQTSRKAKYYLDRISKFKYYPSRSLKAICTESNRINAEVCSGHIPASLWNLLEQMLELDARKRLSAMQLKEHAFFQSLKGGSQHDPMR